MLALIAAVAKNNVIGHNNHLPWHIPEDFARFKALTKHRVALMGRKTFESILARLGAPLPERKNIVITRQENYRAPEGVEVFSSPGAALEAHRGEHIFVIGGGELYREMLPRADTLYLTHIDREYEGDTYFPALENSTWRLVKEEPRDGYRFAVYQKLRKPVE